MIRARVQARRSSRVTAPLLCQVVRERDFRLVADRMVNLSREGALVGPADQVLTGERVIVSFLTRAGAWVDAQAVVARVAHGRRPGERKRELGLNFEALDASSAEALHQCLLACPSTRPNVRRERRSCAR